MDKIASSVTCEHVIKEGFPMCALVVWEGAPLSDAAVPSNSLKTVTLLPTGHFYRAICHYGRRYDGIYTDSIRR